MVNEPSEEQLKKFWEWCGFEQIDYLDTSGNVCGTHYAHPLAQGGGSGDLPKVDLNNLFKYAVPKLQKSHEIRMVTETDGSYIWGILFRPNADPPVIEANKMGKDPALALFWAIWEVIYGE